MTEERGEPAVTIDCPAKVNLILRILAREDTGYHQIETLFQALELHDTLVLRPTGGDVSLSVTWEPAAAAGPSALGPVEDNTVVRAVRLFFEHTRLPGGASAELVKRIPAGTGLGGGSSDAAGALLALNRMHGKPLTSAELTELGGRIGADVPFFCAGASTALAWGRGDRLLGLPSPPEASVVVGIPSVRVSTAEAYGHVAGALTLPAPSRSLAVAELSTWGGIGRLQHNDFEAVTLDRHPVLAALVDALDGAGAVVARMTGSGSAVFGVLEEPDQAHQAALACENLEGVDRAIVTRTRTGGP